MEDIQNIKIKMEKIEKTKKLEEEIFNWILGRLKAYNTENIKNVDQFEIFAYGCIKKQRW